MGNAIIGAFLIIAGILVAIFGFLFGKFENILSNTSPYRTETTIGVMLIIFGIAIAILGFIILVLGSRGGD